MVTASKQMEDSTKNQEWEEGGWGSGISFADSDDLRFPSIKCRVPQVPS
jgi:hypothetical protein